MEDWLSLREAARAAGVGSDTVRRWCDTNKVVSQRTPGGHRRVSAASLQAVLSGATVPAALTGPPTVVVPALVDAVDRWGSWRPTHTVSDDQLAQLRVELVGFDGHGGLVGQLVEFAAYISGLLTERDRTAVEMSPIDYSAELLDVDTDCEVAGSGAATAPHHPHAGWNGADSETLTNHSH